MTRNSERIIEIVDKCFSEADKLTPEDMLFSYRGILYPLTISSPDTLEALKSFEARSDDVILVGYPKSGTNWLEQMVKELADAKYTEEEMKERINAEKKLETFQRLEFGDPGIYERMKQLPSRRIIVTHLRPDFLPPSIFQSKAKVSQERPGLVSMGSQKPSEELWWLEQQIPLIWRQSNPLICF
ncbi:sulfotransferase 6B1-like [Aphelocoma coerulescens]|uniref:sulfotransferase 6B1-like n=1 Tax=Aphelocoma coerulescens TaxID=39617 RepID=UPI003604429A